MDNDKVKCATCDKEMDKKKAVLTGDGKPYCSWSCAEKKPEEKKCNKFK